MDAYIDDQARSHYDGLLEHLDALNIDYVENPRLVRGLDYYNYTVFEWITDDLGAQGTICGGGRYDGLVEQLGGAALAPVHRQNGGRLRTIARSTPGYSGNQYSQICRNQ